VTLRLVATAAACLPLAVFASTADAALPSGNLLQNGDAEAGAGATSDSETQPVPGWNTFPNFTAVVYGTSSFPSTAESAGIGGGRNFFAGGPDNGSGDFAIAQQIVDISAAAPEIDAGGVRATLSGDLGGFETQDDSATATAIFSDNQAQQVNGTLSLDPPTAEQRGGRTTFLHRSACTDITPGARQAFVQVVMQRTSGAYNDGYADNVDLRLSNAPCPAAPDEPLPPPVETPIAGVNANAQVGRGRIFVKRPGSDQFQELRDARSIPVGSEVDATKGTVELETASNNTGGSQTGKFFDGAFVMTQTSGARPITDLTLSGRLDKCSGRAKGGAGAARSSRRLWGNARGRFRTRGRHASASVRGTLWSMRDTCSATTVKVARGAVVVRDFSKRKNIRLKAPKSYTARARRG